MDRMKDWVGGVTRISDVTGPIDQAGTTYSVWFGRMRSVTEVRAAERPRLFRTRSSNWLLSADTEAVFEALDSGTRLTQTFRTRGIIAAAAARIFATGSYRGSFRGELAQFKRIAEREARSI